MTRYKITVCCLIDDKGYNKGEYAVIYNEIFDTKSGIIHHPIDLAMFEIIDFKQFVTKIKDIDIYEDDKVLVKGTKRFGDYETTVVRKRQGWTLDINETYLNDDACLIAIISKI